MVSSNRIKRCVKLNIFVSLASISRVQLQQMNLKFLGVDSCILPHPRHPVLFKCIKYQHIPRITNCSCGWDKLATDNKLGLSALWSGSHVFPASLNAADKNVNDPPPPDWFVCVHKCVMIHLGIIRGASKLNLNCQILVVIFIIATIQIEIDPFLFAI